MLLESVNVGKASPLMMRDGSTVSSGIYKLPVAEPVAVGELGLEGDEQMESCHGGPDKALNLYPAEHYSFWQETLGGEWSAGAFGENLTTRGLLESEVAIGDVFQIGDVVLEVTQARQPCSRLAAKHHLPNLVKLVEQSGRTGFYLRCLQPGTLSAGTEIVRVSRPDLLITVEAAYKILRDRSDLAGAEQLLSLPALSEAWREEASRRFSA